VLGLFESCIYVTLSLIKIKKSDLYLTSNHACTLYLKSKILIEQD